jgi:hypothetical protein
MTATKCYHFFFTQWCFIRLETTIKVAKTPSYYDSSIVLHFIQVGGSLDITLGAYYMQKSHCVAALLGRAFLTMNNPSLYHQYFITSRFS